MKSLLLVSFFVWLNSGVTVSTTTSNITSYDGHKVFRVRTQGLHASLLKKIESLSVNQWNDDTSSHIDIVLAPDRLDAFSVLKLEYDTMHEDLGASIAAESAKSSVWRRQANNSSWFDSYHPYADHQQYWKELQAAFPNNSESISSGTSYEGRDLFGLHLWGAGGPGKPAVLWHGTVHAREWIATMVWVSNTGNRAHSDGNGTLGC